MRPFPARRRTRSHFDAPPSALEQQLIPVISVLIASLAPLLPIIATAPIVPPFGFMMLIAWRLPRPNLWPAWAALPLGFFDDLFSGQPLGSAMAGWTMAMIAVDLLDRRIVWRDHRQDWAMAGALIAGQLTLGLILTRIAGGDTLPIWLLLQLALSVLLFPACVRIAATLDRWRYGQ